MSTICSVLLGKETLKVQKQELQVLRYQKKGSDLSEIFTGRSAFCTVMDPKRVFLPLVVGAFLLPLFLQEFNRIHNESQADVSVKGGGVLNTGPSVFSAIPSLWLHHVEPMIMILTSDPTKLNQVCVLWVLERGGRNVFICREDPCRRWVTDLNFSWHRIDDGGVHREEGSLSSWFIFLPCSRTVDLATCLPFRPWQRRGNTTLACRELL